MNKPLINFQSQNQPNGNFNTFYDDSTNSQSMVKNYAYKLKLFSVHRKRDKSELKDEKEQIKRTLYKCPYCDKSYSSVTRYEVHLRTHTGEKPYGCMYCSKKFNEKGNLKAHLRVHTGERPFPCDFPGCEMRFKTKGQLNDHKHRHSNLRPFKCTFCHSAFNRKTRLKVHLMIHTGEKPFHCTFPGCGKNFREKGNLNSHMKKHVSYYLSYIYINSTQRKKNPNKM